MKFEDFIKKSNVRRATPDRNLVRSLINFAKRDIEFLKNLKIEENSSRTIMVGFYDSLRSLLEAISSLDGYKVYSHEAFVYFLRDRNEDILAEKFDRYRKIRNSIRYYGKDISIEDTKVIVEEIKRMIDYLIGKYLEEFK